MDLKGTLLYICKVKINPMSTTFYKYQGTGNDFVIIDNRTLAFPKNDTKLVHKLCDRKFGVGADGLILLENDQAADFKMVYYNADGNESSMCGNGGRCIVAFAKELGIINGQTVFEAVDGMHEATVKDGIVSLKMQDVDDIKNFGNYVFMNTGSPHHVQFAKELEKLDVKTEGARLRYGKYGKSGSNINFVNKVDTDIFAVRTYERGVEDETLSCGTGVTAVALAMNYLGETNANAVTLKTEGGDLNVSFVRNGDRFENIYLTGPAKLVFKGKITW